MKKVLILVLSCEAHPYQKMVETSLNTWDSLQEENCKTVYYFGRSNKENTSNMIYLPVDESLHTMGEKLLLALEWALKNKDFDFIARPHSSIYVNKKELAKYIQTLPEENVFAGIGVDTKPQWMWGGCGFIFSKDVVQNIVENKMYWRHDLMEDMALSYLINKLGIPYTDGLGCSIDKKFPEGWNCLCYGTPSYDFKYFSEIKKDNGQFFFRCKQDGRREVDAMIMNELFINLK